MFPGIVPAQNPAINKFYRQYKKGEEVRNFKVPGFLIRLGGTIGKKRVAGDIEKQALQLLKYVKGTRLMFTEAGNPIPARAVRQLTEDVRARGFDDWIEVRDGETRVHIMALEKKGKIKNMMIFVHEPDGFVMLSMKMKLKPQHLAQFIQDVLRQELKYEPTPPKPDKKPPKKKKKEVPVV